MNNYNKVQINEIKAGNIVEFIFKNKPIICYIEDVDIKTNKIQVMKLVRNCCGPNTGPNNWVKSGETCTDYDFFKTKDGCKNFDVSKKTS